MVIKTRCETQNVRITNAMKMRMKVNGNAYRVETETVGRSVTV